MNIERKIKKAFNLSLLTSIVFVVVGLFLFIKPNELGNKFSLKLKINQNNK